MPSLTKRWHPARTRSAFSALSRCAEPFVQFIPHSLFWNSNTQALKASLGPWVFLKPALVPGDCDAAPLRILFTILQELIRPQRVCSYQNRSPGLFAEWTPV